MRILIVSAVFPPEPVVSASISYDLAMYLSRTNEVTVLCPRPSRPSGYDFSKSDIEDYPFKRVELNSYVCPDSKLIGRCRENFSFGLAIANYITMNNSKFDVIYANSWPLFSQFYIANKAIKYKIPYIIHVQDIYPESLTKKLPVANKIINSVLLKLDKYILSHAKRIITISDNMREYLIKTRNLEENFVDVVYNWQDEDRFIAVKENSNANKDFTFMFLGSLGPVASLPNLIMAFSMANLQNAKLVIAGDGSEKDKLIEQVDNLNLADKVSFRSAIMNEVPEIQNQADVLVLSLIKGGANYALPSKLPAYMFSKKTILAVLDINSGPSIIVEKSKCGVIVEPDNAEALKNAMTILYNKSETELNEFGNNGFCYALNNLSKKSNLPFLANKIQNI